MTIAEKFRLEFQGIENFRKSIYRFFSIFSKSAEVRGTGRNAFGRATISNCPSNTRHSPDRRRSRTEYLDWIAHDKATSGEGVPHPAGGPSKCTMAGLTFDPSLLIIDYCIIDRWGREFHERGISKKKCL